MIIDNVITELISNASKKANIDVDKGTRILEGFYKGLTHVITHEKAIIKIDYFGKFIYSEAWREKKASLAKVDFSDMKVK